MLKLFKEYFPILVFPFIKKIQTKLIKGNTASLNGLSIILLISTIIIPLILVIINTSVTVNNFVLSNIFVPIGLLLLYFNLSLHTFLLFNGIIHTSYNGIGMNRFLKISEVPVWRVLINVILVVGVYLFFSYLYILVGS